MTLRKCKNEFCSGNIVSDYIEAEYCLKCYMDMLKFLPLFHIPVGIMPYKSTRQMRYNPNACKMKFCKNKARLRGRCFKCYIEFMKKQESEMKSQ